MKVLFVAAEAYPFAKVGGLGDVAYSLPKALVNSDVDVRVILPKYKFPKKIRRKMKLIARYKTYIGWKTVDCELWYLEYNGIKYYFIGDAFYFYRRDLYGYGDDDERFIYFSKAVLEGIKYMKDFQPEVLHCNDWHSSMVIPLKNLYYKGDERYDDIRTIFTIHNIAYQGTFGKDTLWMLGLNEQQIKGSDLEYFDGISFMKWAIGESDKINTVSKSYAEEIKEEGFSCGLGAIIRRRQEDLCGIVNGIDYDIYNPSKDGDIFINYDIEHINLKLKNKLKLQQELKLQQSEEIPMISIISRLADQKGIGLVEAAMHQLMKNNIQLVIVGTGNQCFEQHLQYLQEKYNTKLRVLLEFSNKKAKQVYSASDLFLMPSKFEPCGLGQMIAMRYGTIPVVRAVGGLKDTVKEFNEYNDVGNGFTFKEYSVEQMLFAIDRALNIYNNNKDKWRGLVISAMMQDNTWEKASLKYKNLYEELIKK